MHNDAARACARDAPLRLAKQPRKFVVVTPELCESATGPTGLKLAGPQRGVSKAEMLQKHAFLSDPNGISLVVDEGEDANWVLGEAIVPTEDVGGEIGPAWHHPKQVEERLQPVAAWLKSRPEKVIVVVGHSGVFDKLIGKDMKNCELLEDDLSKWS